MIVTSAGGACRDSLLSFLLGARGGSGSINRRVKIVTSRLWALQSGVTFILTPQVEASQGPGASKMDAKLGVEVEGPFEMICTFLGRSKKVIIVYRHGPREWEPKLSCNDGAGSQIARHVPADGRDPRLMITGWYADGREWKQCELKGWSNGPKGKSLSSQTPSAETRTVTSTT